MVVGRVGGKGLLGEKNKGWGVVGNSGGFPGGGRWRQVTPRGESRGVYRLHELPTFCQVDGGSVICNSAQFKLLSKYS